MAVLKDLHQGFRRAYGAPRLHQALRQKDYTSSVMGVRWLMRELGIKACTTGLYTWAPGKFEFYSSAGNQLAKAEEAKEAGVQWAGDFTYIRTQVGWLYHAVVLDLYKRRVVGWSCSRKRNAELTKSAHISSTRLPTHCPMLSPLPFRLLLSNQLFNFIHHLLKAPNYRRINFW